VKRSKKAEALESRKDAKKAKLASGIRCCWPPTVLLVDMPLCSGAGTDSIVMGGGDDTGYPSGPDSDAALSKSQLQRPPRDLGLEDQTRLDPTSRDAACESPCRPRNGPASKRQANKVKTVYTAMTERDLRRIDERRGVLNEWQETTRT
jgi:hypothetical protein